MIDTGGMWYVGRDGQQHGPFDWATLQSQAATGALTQSDLLWRDGMPEWVPAATIPGLIPSGPLAPLNYPPPVLGYLPPPENALYAGFWRRFAAVLLDGLIMWVVNFVIGFVIGFSIAIAFGRNDPVAQAIGGLLGLVVNWLYEALMVSSANQATLGKMALGVRVIGPAGERISFGRATGRYFAKMLSGLILAIGYLMMLWTERKQTLHDSLAGTYVVKTRP